MGRESPHIASLIMHPQVVSVSGHTTERGTSVFANTVFGNKIPVMFANEPVVEGVFRVDELLSACQALETALSALEHQRGDIGPCSTISDAITSLNWMQIRLEGLLRQGEAMHKSVVECLTDERDKASKHSHLMQDYLSAFAKAVGEGEV